MLRMSGKLQQHQSHMSRHAAFFITWDLSTGISGAISAAVNSSVWQYLQVD